MKPSIKISKHLFIEIRSISDVFCINQSVCDAASFREKTHVQIKTKWI